MVICLSHASGVDRLFGGTYKEMVGSKEMEMVKDNMNNNAYSKRK